MRSRIDLGASRDHPTIFTRKDWEVSDFHGDYIKKHGESSNFSIFADEEEAFAKMRAGSKIDITQPCTYKIPRYHNAGILEPIDTSRLRNWSDITPSLNTPPGGSVFSGKQHFIPTNWG